MQKVVLITGTSSGVGLSTAILFAQKGYRVFASMRNLDKKEALLKEAETNKVDLELVQLDVLDAASVERAIQLVLEKAGKIDILINNAGAGFLRTTEQATEAEIKWVTDLNYFGVVRCTKAVLPQMRAQKGGHIINITSVGGLVGQPFNEFYCAAKFAVEGYTEALATYITEAFGIHFTLVEPGGIRTEFSNSVRKKIAESGGLLEDAYAPILQKYVNKMQQRASEGAESTYQTPAEVAEVILACAENENPPLRIRTSKAAEQFCALKTAADPDGTKLRDAVIKLLLQ